MTRWARAGAANKKKPLEATSWSSMKSADKTSSTKSDNASTSKQDGEEFVKRKRKLNDTEAQHSQHMKSKKKKEAGGTRSSDKVRTTEVTAGSSASEPAVDVLEALTRQSEERERVTLLEFVRKDERREKRRVKRVNERQSKRVCFNCREPGHDLSSCPHVIKDMEQGTGICFKCGSTEHTVAECKTQLPAGKFPYAKCFICKEVGHLSRTCPDNPRGLYPNGGCCKLCGSVEHFRKDCPELQKQQGIQDVKLTTIRQCKSLDDDDETGSTKDNIVQPIKTQTKKKVVQF